MAEPLQKYFLWYNFLLPFTRGLIEISKCFVVMQLFSSLTPHEKHPKTGTILKTEVNEYIAVRSKARPEDFRNGKSSSRAKFAFYSLFRAIALPSGNAQEAERTV